MRTLQQFSRGLIAATLITLAGTVAVAASEKIDDQDFIEEASARGIAEIETARLALEKSTSPQVRDFANAMMADHTVANQKLVALAATKNLEAADEAALVNQAKALILKLRGEASFDKAYANNQVVAHGETIELFRKAARSTDADISGFATTILPKLEHHLQQAEELAATLGADQ